MAKKRSKTRSSTRTPARRTSPAPAPARRPTPSRKGTVPAAWFRQSVERQRIAEAKAFAAKSDAAYENNIARAENEANRRANEKAYLQDSIKLLRKFARGFEARDGFDLRDVARIRGPQLAKLKKFASIIRQEQAQPHVEAVARSLEQRKALESYTGQRDLPGRKRFIVYTEQPDKTSVKVVRPPKSKKKPKKGEPKQPRKPRVEIAVEVPGGTAREEFFHIEDYLGEPPETFKDVKRALKKMLAGDMPHGWYVLVTSNHGNIGAPQQRHRLMSVIEDRYMAYDKVPSAGSRRDDRGLAGVVVGFKLVSFTKEGAEREYRERLSRREMLARERAAQRKRASRDRRARITGRR